MPQGSGGIPKRDVHICIIGGGPSGLACLKVVMDTPQYRAGSWKPVLFESRDQVGGIWLPAPPTANPPLTPLYDSLMTNLPHPIMSFSSFPFPPSTPLFPPAAVVQSYLEAFVSHFDLAKHVRHNTTVQHVSRDLSNSYWQVRLSTDEVLDFDYIVVANGHYSVPRYPDIPGLGEWLDSGKASHSMWYRRPLESMGQVVLVVGGGPSGYDIARDLHRTRVVIHSITGTATNKNYDERTYKVRGPIAEFLPSGRVVFEDYDGTSEGVAVDHCILATGYEISFPFLPEAVLKPDLPPTVPPLPKHLYNSTYHLFPLMKWLFPLQAHYPPTSIAFPGLVYRIAPLPFAEAQALALVKAWTDPQSIDVAHEASAIISRYEHFKRLHGADELRIAREYPKFEPMDQFDYRDELIKFAFGGQDGSQEELKGNLVPEWHRKIYAHKGIVAKEWTAIVQRDEAEEFVRGVGQGGPHEWEGTMLRLLAMALEREGKRPI